MELCGRPTRVRLALIDGCAFKAQGAQRIRGDYAKIKQRKIWVAEIRQYCILTTRSRVPQTTTRLIFILS